MKSAVAYQKTADGTFYLEPVHGGTTIHMVNVNGKCVRCKKFLVSNNEACKDVWYLVVARTKALKCPGLRPKNTMEGTLKALEVGEIVVGRSFRYQSLLGTRVQKDGTIKAILFMEVNRGGERRAIKLRPIRVKPSVINAHAIMSRSSCIQSETDPDLVYVTEPAQVFEKPMNKYLQDERTTRRYQPSV